MGQQERRQEKRQKRPVWSIWHNQNHILSCIVWVEPRGVAHNISSLYIHQTHCSLTHTSWSIFELISRLYALKAYIILSRFGHDVPRSAGTKAVFLRRNSLLAYVTAGRPQLSVGAGIHDLSVYSALYWCYERDVCYWHGWKIHRRYNSAFDHELVGLGWRDSMCHICGHWHFMIAKCVWIMVQRTAHVHLKLKTTWWLGEKVNIGTQSQLRIGFCSLACLSLSLLWQNQNLFG